MIRVIILHCFYPQG